MAIEKRTVYICDLCQAVSFEDMNQLPYPIQKNGKKEWQNIMVCDNCKEKMESILEQEFGEISDELIVTKIKNEKKEKKENDKNTERIKETLKQNEPKEVKKKSTEKNKKKDTPIYDEGPLFNPFEGTEDHEIEEMKKNQIDNKKEDSTLNSTDTKTDIKPGTSPKTLEEDKPKSLSQIRKELNRKLLKNTNLVNTNTVYNIHDIRLKAKKGSQIQEIRFIVAPLSIPDNGSIPGQDIAVYVRAFDKDYVFSSEKDQRTSVTLRLASNEFIIRGSWERGVFQSYVYTTGETRQKYEMEDKQKCFLSSDLNQKIFQERYLSDLPQFDTKLYILPISQNNEPNGLAKIVIIKDGGTKREGYYPNEDCIQFFTFHDKMYRVYGKWENNDFIKVVEEME